MRTLVIALTVRMKSYPLLKDHLEAVAYMVSLKK